MDSAMAISVDVPSEVAARPVRPVRKRRLGWLAFKLVATGMAAGALGFNGWWYWRDHRPLPAMATIFDWVTREKYAEAENALREYLRRSPHDGDVRMSLARSLAARGDFKGCARTLHKVPAWWPSKVEALLREGQAYLQADRAKDAEAAWLEAIKDDPLHPLSLALYHDVCQEILKLYAIEDRWEDAFPVMWTAYDHANPVDHPVLLLMRLRCELERVAPKETLVHLRKYVTADPTDWEARRAMARALLMIGQHAEAARDFEACIKGRPDDVRAWRDYLAMLLDQGDLETFRSVLEKPPPSADTEPETWLYRAVAHEKTGDWKGAADDWQKAIDLNPFMPKYHYRLAMVQERLGLREEAKIHRQRNKEMNEARAQLRTAYFDYFALLAKNEPDSAAMAAACRELARVCEVLGWSRAAQAWNQLARQA
jgi:tetratricopeptide (TPR) repeat protein